MRLVPAVNTKKKKALTERRRGSPVPNRNLSDLRETLSAGFIEIHNGLSPTSRPLILVPDRFCTKPLIPFVLVSVDDGSNMSQR